MFIFYFKEGGNRNIKDEELLRWRMGWRVFLFLIEEEVKGFELVNSFVGL